MYIHTEKPANLLLGHASTNIAFVHCIYLCKLKEKRKKKKPTVPYCSLDQYPYPINSNNDVCQINKHEITNVFELNDIL